MRTRPLDLPKVPVARRTGFFADNCRRLADQPVKEVRLAHIGATYNSDDW